MKVKHILMTYEYELEDLKGKLDRGESFEELARKFSKCPSHTEGGDLGFIQKGRTVEEFEEAALQLKVGEISPPTRTKFGWHLIYRYA